MVFQCSKCREPFEQDGLQIIIHGVTVGHVCPECLANANTVSITMSRPRPGKDFAIQYVETSDEPVSGTIYVVKDDDQN